MRELNLYCIPYLAVFAGWVYGVSKQGEMSSAGTGSVACDERRFLIVEGDASKDAMLG